MTFALRIDPKKRAAGRFIGQVRDVLIQAVLSAEKDGVNRAEIARRINCNRSRITRQLRGTSDLTLRSIAEIAWAIGMKPEILLSKVEIELPETNEKVGKFQAFPNRLQDTDIVTVVSQDTAKNGVVSSGVVGTKDQEAVVCGWD